MRKFISFLLFLATVGITSAEDYTYLVVETDEGGTTLYAQGLQMTFTNNQLTATDINGSHTFPLNRLVKMYFTNTASISDRKLEAETGEVIVYTPSGICMGKYDGIDAAKKQLSKGVYIIKSSSRTYKTTIE